MKLLKGYCLNPADVEFSTRAGLVSLKKYSSYEISSCLRIMNPKTQRMTILRNNKV